MNAPVVWPKAARSIPNPEYNSLTSSPDLHALSQFRMHIIASDDAEAAAEYFRAGRSRCTHAPLCIMDRGRKVEGDRGL